MFSCRISNTVTDGKLSSSVLCFLVGPVIQLLIVTIKQYSVCFLVGPVIQLLMVYYQVVFCVFL